MHVSYTGYNELVEWNTCNILAIYSLCTITQQYENTTNCSPFYL